MKLNTAAVLLTIGFGTACWSQEAQRKSAPPGDIQRPVITLERTACLGTCPVYGLRILPSGLVEFEGGQHVKVIGKAEGKIETEQINRLVQRFLATDFFRLKNEYVSCRNPDGTYSMVSDLPTTIISLSWKGQKKTVVDYVCAPKKLESLEEEVERVVNSHRWLHQDDLKNKSTVASDAYLRIKPGFSKLMQAAGTGDAYTFEHLISIGTDVNAQDETGWTALMVATEMGQKYMVDRLLEVHANPLLKDQNGETSIIAAAIGCRSLSPQRWEGPILSALLAAGAHPDDRTSLGDTALMLVARTGNYHCVESLLKGGADLRLVDSNGRTALQIAEQAREEAKTSYSAKDFDRVTELLQNAPVSH